MGCGASSPGVDNTIDIGIITSPDDLKLGKKLGNGMSCDVFKVVHVPTRRDFAIKKLPMTSENKKMYEAERDLLLKLRHPNILEYAGHWTADKHYCLLTKLYSGGELFDRICALGSFSEKNACNVAYQMVSAISYSHKNQVVHRDLKPENFVFADASLQSDIKLIDFGCAVTVVDSKTVGDFCGSPFYMSPEVVRGMDEHESEPMTGAYWKKADMWSIGVIVFIMMAGWPPFTGSTQSKMFKRICRGEYEFPTKEHDDRDLSDKVKNFIKRCLVVDPNKRITADEALQHPWIRGVGVSDKAMGAGLLKNIQDFTQQNKLRKMVGRMMCANMSPKDQEELAALFKEYDTNGDGKLDPQEIAAMMKKIGVTEHEAKMMAKELDEDGDGNVDINELGAVHFAAKAKANNREIFKKFDKDGDGFVTAREILAVCDWMSNEEVNDIFTQADGDGDGRLGFDEWVKAMGNAGK